LQTTKRKNPQNKFVCFIKLHNFAERINPMPKLRKTINIDKETADKVEELSVKQKRSFSQMSDILLNKGIEVTEKRK